MNTTTTEEELSRLDVLLEDCANDSARIWLELEWLEMRGLADEEIEAA